MMRSLTVLALLLTVTMTGTARAQTPSPAPNGEELVDRVIAVVGDTALLLSDLQAAVQQQQAAGRQIPQDPVQFQRFMQEMLDERINSLLLVEAARDAGITITDDQLDRAVEGQIQQVLRSFGGSQTRLDAALQQDGMTMTQYRDILRQQFRDDQLMRTYMGQRMRARARPVISEDEIRAAFETQRERLGMRPPTITFRQVLVSPEPSDSADAAARKEAEEVYLELQDGGDWEVLARRFSDDPGSREVGGDLGWVRQGEGLVQDFERMAFSIRPGIISPIFRSDFGYHILQVRRVQGAERQVRHILISPEITEDDMERARVRADSVVQAIEDGANVLTLARSYDTPSEQIEIQPIPISELPGQYAEELADAQTGSVVGPFQVPGAGADSWAVVRVTLREEERPFTLQDVREQLVLQLQEAEMIDQIVSDLRSSIHVAIRL